MVNLYLTWGEAFGKLYGGAESKEPFADMNLRSICKCSPEAIHAVRGIGWRTVDEIKERLEGVGLRLGMTDEELMAICPIVKGGFLELHSDETGTPFTVNVRNITEVTPSDGHKAVVCLLNGKSRWIRESYKAVKNALTQSEQSWN